MIFFLIITIINIYKYIYIYINYKYSLFIYNKLTSYYNNASQIFIIYHINIKY